MRKIQLRDAMTVLIVFGIVLSCEFLYISLRHTDMALSTEERKPSEPQNYGNAYDAEKTVRSFSPFGTENKQASLFRSEKLFSDAITTEKRNWTADNAESLNLGDIKADIFSNVYWLLRNEDIEKTDSASTAAPAIRRWTRVLYSHKEANGSLEIVVHCAANGRSVAAYPELQVVGKPQYIGVQVKSVNSHTLILANQDNTAKSSRAALRGTIQLRVLERSQDQTIPLDFAVTATDGI